MSPMRRPANFATSPVDEGSCSLTHLAHRWNKSRREIRQMLQHGELPFEQVNGQIRVPCQAVQEFEKKLQCPIGGLSTD